MFQKYPYTDYHELNLDYIMKLARESMGLHLEVSGNELLLKNDLNETLSHVVIAYADKALYDAEGNEISAYIISAGRDGRAIAFTKGNGDVVSVALPDDAIYDKNGKEITSYIAKVDVASNKLRVTDGEGNAYTFTCPYSTSAGKATTDDNGKNLTTYVADINVSGNDIVVKDGEGNVLRTFTVSYATNSTNAEKATKDGDGDVIKSTYGAELIVDGTKIGLEAKDGTTLNKITVPFATLATDATNAIESVTVTGNQLQFRTFGGTVTNITVPYALKATNDGSNNEIVKSYVADVTNDALTGKITFLAMDGSTIAELIPTVDSAVHDSYDNLIADFVKTIAVSAGSDYVTVTHGTGTTETLLIDYANRAWKDTNGNIIKNVYLKSLECLPDSDTGHYVLVGYNGENSEILRIEIYAYMAQRAIGDEDGNNIKSSYVASGAMNGSNLELKAKDNTVLSTINIPSGGVDPDVYGNSYAIVSTSGLSDELNFCDNYNVGHFPTHILYNPSIDYTYQLNPIGNYNIFKFKDKEDIYRGINKVEVQDNCLYQNILWRIYDPDFEADVTIPANGSADMDFCLYSNLQTVIDILGMQLYPDGSYSDVLYFSNLRYKQNGNRKVFTVTVNNQTSNAVTIYYGSPFPAVLAGSNNLRGSGLISSGNVFNGVNNNENWTVHSCRICTTQRWNDLFIEKSALATDGLFVNAQIISTIEGDSISNYSLEVQYDTDYSGSWTNFTNGSTLNLADKTVLSLKIKISRGSQIQYITAGFIVYDANNVQIIG